MKRMLVFMLIAVMVIMLLSPCVAEGSIRPGSYVLGAKINDFTFHTYDGQSATLSEVLDKKDMVLINIWASWCGPCRMEFPYLQEAYAQYQDRVEVIALSCEPTDTNQNLAQFAAQYGLTFKVGHDEVGFLRALNINSIPASLVVDRFGVICFVSTGAQTSTDSFTRLFDVFVGDDYTESVLLTDIPSRRPDIEAATDEEISAAIETRASAVSSANVWPMTVTNKDGRNVVVSSNKGVPSSVSAVTVTVDACAGDAIVVKFKTSTEPVFDALRISVNDTVIKYFAGQHDWMTYAIPVEETGTYTVILSYHKDHVADSGEDAVWVDYVAVTTDGAAAFAENPQYPTTDALTFEVVSPTARQVEIDDPSGILYNTFGPAKYYVVNSDTVDIAASLTKDIDPERAFLVNYFDGSYINMAQTATQHGYRISTGVDSFATTGYRCSYVMLYEDVTGKEPMILVNFRDEENLNGFVIENGLGDWRYVENDAPLSNGISAAEDEAIYEIKCVDTAGQPVPGVMLQICDESTCQVVVTDEYGSYSLKLHPYAWEVHILKAPEGYVANPLDVMTMPVQGGSVTFVLEKK